MALGATVYTFKIELADSDRAVYTPLDLRVARHPSETEEHLLTRVLAYCLEYTEGISFSNGLSDSDQPAISRSIPSRFLHNGWKNFKATCSFYIPESSGAPKTWPPTR